jgi:hypothetical protein
LALLASACFWVFCFPAALNVGMKRLLLHVLLKTAVIAVVFSGLVAAWTFICIAFYLWMRSSQGGVVAALWTAAFNLFLIFLLILFSWRPWPKKKPMNPNLPLVVGEMMGNSVAQWARRNTIEGVVAVLCAGFLLGFSRRLRTLVLRLLR